MGQPPLARGSGKLKNKMLCGEFWETLEPNFFLFKIRTLARSKIKFKLFLKQNTFQIGRSGGVNLQNYLTATLQTT